MPWARIDDTFYDHPKVLQTSLAALGLHLKALSWCNRHLTDGAVPVEAVRMLGATVKMADELVSTGLWERAPRGYVIHDFLRYSKSKSDVESERDKWAESKRDSRKSRAVPFPFPSPVPKSRSSSNEMERAGDVLPRIVRPQ